MNVTKISHKLKTITAIAACAMLSIGVADAKKDKGKGGKDKKTEKADKGKDQKGKKDKKAKEKHDKKSNDHKGKDKKDDGKDYEKELKEYQKEREAFFKDREKRRKEYEKDRKKYDKEFAKYRERRFRDNERNDILKYFGIYRDRDLGLPPGLAKQYRDGKALPPGWRKKVNRGYVIEDDYDQYFYPVSYDRFPNIERVPDTRLYYYGDRLVQVYEPRREVIDYLIIPTINLGH